MGFGVQPAPCAFRLPAAAVDACLEDTHAGQMDGFRSRLPHPRSCRVVCRRILHGIGDRGGLLVCGCVAGRVRLLHMASCTSPLFSWTVGVCCCCYTVGVGVCVSRICVGLAALRGG